MALRLLQTLDENDRGQTLQAIIFAIKDHMMDNILGLHAQLLTLVAVRQTHTYLKIQQLRILNPVLLFEIVTITKELVDTSGIVKGVAIPTMLKDFSHIMRMTFQQYTV
jgi:hypothetical protein